MECPAPAPCNSKPHFRIGFESGWVHHHQTVPAFHSDYGERVALTALNFLQLSDEFAPQPAAFGPPNGGIPGVGLTVPVPCRPMPGARRGTGRSSIRTPANPTDG
jgi:hypothetical protein